MFCYLCGMVGHGSNQCSRQSLEDQSCSSPPLFQAHDESEGIKVRMAMDTLNDGLEARFDQTSSVGKDLHIETDETNFGPWMLVSQ